jgi:hypothetical protein
MAKKTAHIDNKNPYEQYKGLVYGRCGSHFVNGTEKPVNARTEINHKNGREFYVSGIGEKAMYIRYMDNGQFEAMSFVAYRENKSVK